MIKILLFLARIFGKLVGLFARTQTRLLSKAQFLGWMPTAIEEAKLMRRKFQLFSYDRARKTMKAVRKIKIK